MRINCHAHIFNFRSVFTSETVRILINRISRENWPASVQQAAEKVINKALKGEHLDEDRLLLEFVQAIKADTALTDLVKSISTAEFAVVIEGDAATVPAKLLKKFLDRVSARLISPEDDAREQNLRDFIEFLRIGLKPSIETVADDLVATSGPETAMVALTLDITKGGDKDDELYQAQLRDTAAATRAHPGRILPFVCVNPARTLHYERMTHALEDLGYVGVKLYPSLGYSIDTTAMRRVYTYCETHDVPILLHCNRGGFYRDVASIDFCNPTHWEAVLTSHPKLKVCFGHFGGDSEFVGDLPPADWSGAIIDMMRRHPGVYADISYHDGPFDGGEAAANYFRHLKSLLADPVVGSRILFGTDYHLIRQRVRDDNYWKYFAARFTAAEFRRLAESNPRDFLGLPDAIGRGARLNIVSHLRYLAKYNHEVRREPADWVLAAIKTNLGELTFHPNENGSDWSINNPAHKATWHYFRETYFTPQQLALSFNAAGKVRMRDLPDWPPEKAFPTTRPTMLRQMATHMMNHMTTKAGATKNPGKSVPEIRSALIAKFNPGDTRVAAFGPVIDSSYLF